MSLPSSGELSKSNDVVSDKFPVGLRVLAVDDDPTCLKILEKMLKTCRYEVTKCNQAQDALKLLRENKDGFDIVMSDVYMPDMDGLALLERVGLEMDLPVIMMSADDSLTVVMNGVKHGACDYLIKPVRMEALKTIWQHVVRKKGHQQLIETDDFLDRSVSLEDEEEEPENRNDSSSGDEVGPTDNPMKRRAREEEEGEENGNANASSTKKQRVVWSCDLHREFVKSVNDLGIDKAVPKKILEKMNVPGLKRENVASHLQKYRIYLRKMMKERQQRGNLFDDSFKIPPDFAYGSKFQAHNTHFTDHNSMFQSSSMLSTGNMNTSSNIQVDQQQNMQSWESFRPSLSQSSIMYAAPPPSSSSSLLRQNDFASPQIGQARTQILNEVEHNRLLSQGLNSNFLDQYGISSNRHLPASSAQPSTYSRAHFQDYPQIHDSRFTTPLASNYGPGLSNSSRAPVLQEPNQFVSVETSSNMPNGFIANYDGFNHPENTFRHGGEAIVSQQLTLLSLVDNNASRANVDAMLMTDVGFDNDFISFPDNLCHDELMISALLSQQEAPGPVEGYLGPNLPQQQH